MVMMVDQNDPTARVPCDIIVLHTSQSVIACTTRFVEFKEHSFGHVLLWLFRAAPVMEKDSVFELQVHSSDGEIFQEVQVCSTCVFKVAT